MYNSKDDASPCHHSCHHIIFVLEEDPVNPTFAYIGPYTLDNISKQHLTRLTEKYHFPAESTLWQ